MICSKHSGVLPFVPDAESLLLLLNSTVLQANFQSDFWPSNNKVYCQNRDTGWWSTKKKLKKSERYKEREKNEHEWGKLFQIAQTHGKLFPSPGSYKSYLDHMLVGSYYPTILQLWCPLSIKINDSWTHPSQF